MMRAPTFFQTVLGLVVVVAMASPGCGSGDSEASSAGEHPTTSSSSTSAGSGGGGHGGGGGAGGQGGQGGTGDLGHSSTETVTAGEVSKSPNYKMVFTFGQPTQNQGATKSPSYELKGGLVGATGSKP